jgi:radical SAM enzyme (TIGR01210 family)
VTALDLSHTIGKNTLESGKSYEFTENVNARLPAQYWFQHTPDGLVFFIVFYTQACRWSQCLGCNLPSKMSQSHIPFQDIMTQTDFIFDYLLSAEEMQTIQKIIISNNGSILDEDTFSTTALVYFIAKMNMHCPRVTTLTIETRPEYADMEELEILSRILKEGDVATRLELAIGFEAFDDRIRNDIFRKGMTLKLFEKFAAQISKHGFTLKTYFMVKPVPGMTEEEGIEDICAGIDYLDRIAKKNDIRINMHLNPTYVAYGTPLETAFLEGRYTPPLLDTVRKAMLHAEGKSISLFAGLNDEGLAVPGGTFLREGDQNLVELMEEFNRTQNYGLLRNANEKMSFQD